MLNKLNSILNRAESDLVKEVIEIVIDEAGESNEEIIAYLENVTMYGCVNGTVSSLIYCSDTEAFFDRHVDEILELVNKFIEETGASSFELTRNNIAWLVFEQIACELYNELCELV